MQHPRPGYADARGVSILREVLVAYLRRVRAVVSQPELIVIRSGFAQGTNLVCVRSHRVGSGASRSRIRPAARTRKPCRRRTPLFALWGLGSLVGGVAATPLGRSGHSPVG
jgi:hypothetical protein